MTRKRSREVHFRCQRSRSQNRSPCKRVFLGVGGGKIVGNSLRCGGPKNRPSLPQEAKTSLKRRGSRVWGALERTPLSAASSQIPRLIWYSTTPLAISRRLCLITIPVKATATANLLSSSQGCGQCGSAPSLLVPARLSTALPPARSRVVASPRGVCSLCVRVVHCYLRPSVYMHPQATSFSLSHRQTSPCTIPTLS